MVDTTLKSAWWKAQMLKTPCLNGKRDREFGSVSSREQKNSCLRDKISMITLEEKPGKLFKVESIAQRNLSEAETERDRMWDKRNSDWAAMYGMNSQFESQQSE